MNIHMSTKKGNLNMSYKRIRNLAKGKMENKVRTCREEIRPIEDGVNNVKIRLQEMLLNQNKDKDGKAIVNNKLS